MTYGVIFGLFGIETKANFSKDDRSRFTYLSLICVGVGFLFAFIFHLGVKEPKPEEEEDEEDDDEDGKEKGQDILIAMGHLSHCSSFLLFLPNLGAFTPLWQV